MASSASRVATEPLISILQFAAKPWTTNCVCKKWKAPERVYSAILAAFQKDREFQDFIAVALETQGPDSAKVRQILTVFKLYIPRTPISSFNLSTLATTAARLNQEVVAKFDLRSTDFQRQALFFQYKVKPLVEWRDKAHLLRLLYIDIGDEFEIPDSHKQYQPSRYKISIVDPLMEPLMKVSIAGRFACKVPSLNILSRESLEAQMLEPAQTPTAPEATASAWDNVPVIGPIAKWFNW
jgi:hypothetical protein